MVRQFGVEIEIETPGRRGHESRDWLEEIVEASIAHLNPNRTQNVGYSHRVTPFWKITSDGSVSLGSEVVSPILKGSNGEKQVRAVCIALRAHYPEHVELSTSCGVHVHLDIMGTSWAPSNFSKGDGQTVCDMRRRSPKFKRITNRLFETTRWFDPAIRQILPASRRDNGFCRPFENGYSPDEWVDWFENYYPDLNDRSSARYYRINFSNCFNEFGTFEWRSHAGSINGTKIMQWTKLCQKFLTFSYAPEWQHKDPHDFPRDLDGMINCFELPADQVRFWQNRARQLGNYTASYSDSSTHHPRDARTRLTSETSLTPEDETWLDGVPTTTSLTDDEMDELRNTESVAWYDWIMVEVDVAARSFGRDVARQEYTDYTSDPDQESPVPPELFTDESTLLIWPDVWARLPAYPSGGVWFDAEDYNFENEPSEELLVTAEESFTEAYNIAMDEEIRDNASIPLPYRNPSYFSTLVEWLDDAEFYHYYVNMSNSQLNIFYGFDSEDSVLHRQASLEGFFRAEGGIRPFRQRSHRVRAAANEAAESAVYGFGHTGRNTHDWRVIFDNEAVYRESISPTIPMEIGGPLTVRLLWMSTLVVNELRDGSSADANELRPLDPRNIETFVETFLIGIRELI